MKKAVATHYQDAGRIQADLQVALGLPMSRDTVKRFLKKNDYSWHQLRLTTKPFQDPLVYADGYQRWQILLTLWVCGLTELYFADSQL